MLEREIIQSVGFRNIVEDGKVTGFQFMLRLPYYRGIYLCQLRPGTVIIDGERIEKEDIIWNVDGNDMSYEEMKHDMNTFWAITKKATIKVKKEGGLAQGYHDLTYGYAFSSSYMPPIMQNSGALDPDKEPMIQLPEFGKHVNSRRMLIV